MFFYVNEDDEIMVTNGARRYEGGAILEEMLILAKNEKSVKEYFTVTEKDLIKKGMVSFDKVKEFIMNNQGE